MKKFVPTWLLGSFSKLLDRPRSCTSRQRCLSARRRSADMERLEPRLALSAGPVVISSVYGHDDIRGDTQTKHPIAINGSFRSVINHLNDQDWFRVQLQAGRTYDFRLNRLAVGRTPALGDPFMALHDANGKRLVFNDNASRSNPNSLIPSFRPRTDGTYYVAASGAKGSRGGYVLSAEVRPATILHPPLQTPTLQVPSVNRVSNVNWVNDRHQFPIRLNSLQRYQIDVIGLDQRLDPQLRIYKKAGRGWILEDNNFDRIPGVDRNSRLIFAPRQPGLMEYMIEVRGERNTTGAFRVVVTRIT